MAAILFVEDDVIARRSVAHFLRLSGYDVYEAEDGEAAVRLLSNVQFDLVISDLNIPGPINGLDVLASLTRLAREIDAVLITGAGSDDVKHRARSLGALYIEKPVPLDELEKIVQQRVRS